MIKSILVIGSVTSKQYAPIRQQINLLGDRAQIVRYNSADFICTSSDLGEYDAQGVVLEAEERFKERHGVYPDEFQKRYDIDDDTMKRIFDAFADKIDNSNEEDAVRTKLSKLPEGPFEAVVIDMEVADRLHHEAITTFVKIFEQLIGRPVASIWVATDIGNLRYDTYCQALFGGIITSIEAMTIRP